MYVRAQFNQRTQKDEESVDDFITDLHNLAKKCEFDPLEDELIRDRIVAGMNNTELSIQNLEEEPKLEAVINRVRHSKLVEANSSMLNPNVQAKVNMIKKKQTKKFTINTSTEASCRKCGRTPKHKFSECEAAKSNCKGCGLKGHWLAVCKKVQTRR